MNRPKLSLDQVHALLDKLESDDAFRALFQADAAAGLAQVGAPVEAARCLTVKTLASKETIHATRLALTSQLVGFTEQRVFLLEESSGITPRVVAKGISTPGVAERRSVVARHAVK